MIVVQLSNSVRPLKRGQLHSRVRAWEEPGVRTLWRKCFLGSYARADGRDNKPVPPLTGDEAFAEAATWLENIRAGRSTG